MEKEVYFILRSLLDPVTFLESFVKIETAEGLVKWKMEEYQKNLVRDFSKNRAIVKSKKTGISTTLAGEALHSAYVNAGRHKVLVSTGQRIAGEMLGKFLDEYDSMPANIQVELTNRSAEMVMFPNKVRVSSLPSGNPDSIRGLGMRGVATDVILDEYAFAPNDKQLWLVVRDFQRFGGRVTLNSTPKGKRGKYYEICEPLQTVHRKLSPYRSTDWSYHEIPYWRCERLKIQERSLREDITDIEFQEEYCCEFIDESLSFFPYEMIWESQKVHKYAEGNSGKPQYAGIDFGEKVSETVIIVVEEYEPEKFKVIHVEPLPGVDYPGQIETIKQINMDYDLTTINVDASGPGGQVLYELLGKEENLSSKIWGFTLTSQFKEKLCIRTRILMSRDRLHIPDKNCRYGDVLESQLHQVRRTTTQSGEHTRYSGKQGGSGMDDYVWALALAVYKEFSTDRGGAYFEVQKDPVLERLAAEREEFIWESD